MTKPWKLLLGLGLACAACCAIPLLGIAGGMAALGASLWACADEFIPAALILLAFAGAAGALHFWRRRRSASQPSCGCATQPKLGDSHASR